MKSRRIRLAVAAAGFGLAIAGAGASLAQDAQSVINQRQELMKQQGRDVAAVRAFVEGRGDQAAAQRGAADLLTTIPRIASLFPQRTSSAEFPGRTRARPVIWSEWDQFNAAQQNALSRAQALNAALNTGNTAAVQTALTDLVNSGCNGCHGRFREPQQ
ncbi:MAG: cytochrome c [Alphaproteobacteria bacterium]